jgi:carbon monoxide dehydrogenase subunit G
MTTMASITCEQHIAAPPERVFSVFTNLSEAASQVQGIDSIEMLTEGPVGIGTRFRETRTMFGRSATEVMEFVMFDPPRAYGLHAQSHGCRYRTSFDFTPEGAGTRVAMTFEGTPLTQGTKIMSFLMRPLMARMIRKCVAQDMSDLKAVCERKP